MVWVTNARKNIINFLEKISYTYCNYKEKSAIDTLHYLKWKESLGKGVYSFKPVPYFEDWQKKYVLGDCAYSYVTQIQKIPDPEYVYCIATENQKFIANDIIVHNCDALTKEAQQALRRTMENYTQTTRFVLSCNYSSKIIDPIQSRCTVFRFKPLEKEDMSTIFDTIAHKEGITLDAKAQEALYVCSEGDCRKAENILQSCAAVTKKVSEDDIFSLASVAKPKEVSEFLNLALQNKFIPAREKLLDTMLKYGLSGLDIIKQIQKEVWNLSVTDQQKVMLVDKCGEIEFRMTEGADEFVQLEALLAQFTLCKK
jgi:DNA polymerase III delta prime subunit